MEIKKMIAILCIRIQAAGSRLYVPALPTPSLTQKLWWSCRVPFSYTAHMSFRCMFSLSSTGQFGGLQDQGGKAGYEW